MQESNFHYSIPTNNQRSNTFGWYALQVRKASEQRIQDVLARQSYTTYLPVQAVRKRFCDRVKDTAEPLYPGYLFCECDLEGALAVRATSGVTNFVSFGGAPCKIPDDEIEAVRLLSSSGEALKIAERTFIGKKVDVVAGPLKGLQGTVSSFEGVSILAVAITLLNRSLTVRLDTLDVRIA